MSALALTCSAAARELAEQPIGTAGCSAGFLLVEWPLPWPRDVSDVESLAPVVAAAMSHGVRVQLIAGSRLGAEAMVILHRKPPLGDGSFRRYVRSSITTTREGVVDAALALLGGDARAASSDEDDVVDLLVCTHGKRDRCCGSLGTSLYQELTQRSDQLGPTVRVWRTSHLGGHRFAATTLVLPSGTMWAFMDAELIAQAVGSVSSTDALLGHYRGSAGLQSPAAQALEHAVIAQVGWDVTTSARRVEVDATGGLRLSMRSSTGQTRQWTAKVWGSGAIPAPRCGSSPDSASDVVPQWSVDDLREVATGAGSDDVEPPRRSDR